MQMPIESRCRLLGKGTKLRSFGSYAQYNIMGQSTRVSLVRAVVVYGCWLFGLRNNGETLRL